MQVVGDMAYYICYKEWCCRVSTGFLFYFHITFTGLAIAAASYHFATVIGAPTPCLYPVVRDKGGLGMAVVLWLLSGPVALIHTGFEAIFQRRPLSAFWIVAILAALIWAFCLGVLALEVVFQLFQG